MPSKDKIEFFYKHFPKPTSSLRPVAEIDLKYHNEKMRVVCIIDSGADNCTFPLAFAQILRIPADELRKAPCQTTCACGKTAVNHKVSVEVEIGNYSIPLDAVFVPKRKDGEEITPLLGREGIFDKFDILFEKGQRKIIFSKK